MEISALPTSSSPMASGLPQQPRVTSNASGEPLSSSPRSGNSSSSSSSADRPSDVSIPFSDTTDSNVLRHPKGKRKRTAAKDKSILEAAYLANPKPDKTARLDIVSQVSLNEKEVQIWFQNRRQNDRRKSRPLSAQEIAALRFGGMHALSSDPLPPFTRPVSMHTPYPEGPVSSSPPTHQQFNSASMVPHAPSTTPLSSPELGPWMPDALARKQAEEQRQHQQQEPNGIQTPLLNRSFSSSVSSVGYLANRWNMHSSFSTPSSFSSSGSNHRDGARDDSVKLEPYVSSAPLLPPLHQQQEQHHPTQRPFRLSLSLDGKAEVVASQSPSPPRLPPPQPSLDIGKRSGSSGSSSGSDSPLPSLPAIRRSGLNRSHSALPSFGFTLPPISSLTGSLAGDSAHPQPSQSAQAPHPPRLLRGRSRDVHAWESVCDAETRVDDELSEQAQHEASGSAIAAISLLRSTSSMSGSAMSPSSVLQPNSNKRNTPTRSAIQRPGAKRAKLGRASSSVARMQSVPYASDSLVQDDKEKVWVDEEKKKKLKLSTLLSGNDSDKENWSPDEDGNPIVHPQRPGGVSKNSAGGRRPLPSARNLQQNRGIGRLLNSEGGKGSSGHHRATSDVLAARQPGTKTSRGGALPFDGHDIYEDSTGEGRPAPPKRAQLSRAATLPGTDDVDRFMHGAEVSPSKKGDLDCVAGLLSLSQGNWR